MCQAIASQLSNVTQTEIDQVHQFLEQLQHNICSALEQREAAAGSSVKFVSDNWIREPLPNGESTGGGRSNVLQDGVVIEKGGVMFSHIHIDNLPASASARHPQLVGAKAQALGVSLVIHPKNPNVPTSHANVRFFVAQPTEGPAIWWFGGGFDLTPFYPIDDDITHWHNTALQACAPFGDTVYDDFKQWCDDYFYLKHRDEQRGVGGLFFDDLNEWGFEKSFAFMQAVGQGYIDGIIPIFEKRQDMPYTQAQRDFQLYRRGRYVEFNLVYDRGTLFGLQTGGRIESILVSLPNLAGWSYRPEWNQDTAEFKLKDYYLKPQNWLNRPVKNSEMTV